VRQTRLLAEDGTFLNAAAEAIAANLDRLIDERRRQLLKALRRAGDSARKLHRLRLKIKFLRYLCEEFEGASNRVKPRQLKSLRKLQDCLGTLRDERRLQRLILGGTPPDPAALRLSRRLAAEGNRQMRIFSKHRRKLRRAC
jgi:CHAD domain-containing protein